ncbi:hypothetical protein HpBT0224_05980 [Helicobacter pylori]
MGKVQMDTEEVREFVNHLERFKELLNDEVNGLSSHFNNLDSWQDARRDKFSEVLDNLKALSTSLMKPLKSKSHGLKRGLGF